MRRLALVFLLPVLLVSALAGQTTPEQVRRNLESFDHVWETVIQKNWDPALGGLDWRAVREELRPKVEKAASDAEVRAIIADMLSRLHLTHYGVIPGSVYEDVENDRTGGTGTHTSSETGTAGIDVRVVNGEALVFRVERDSPAFKQGVRAGWVIRRIDDEEIAPMLQRVGATYQDSTMRPLILARTVTGPLDGPLAESVRVEFRDGRDKTAKLTLDRKSHRGTPEHFGFMPESWLWIDTHQIANDIGYIAFDYFLDPTRLTGAFQEEIEKCSDCSGMVIDLRGNPGGIGILAMGLAGYFIEKPDLKLGTLRMRNLPMKFVVNPRSPSFRGPLAILIDGLSASTSEIFAGGLQDLKRARIFGSRSAGAALPSMFERLPNGDGFQYAMATYQSESGKTLEGHGVIPDVETPLTREALLAGSDPALDAAVQWVHEQSQKGISSR